MIYTVYLRTKKTLPANDPLLDFNLDYRKLDVILNLKDLAASQPNSIQVSHIDVSATNLCFSTGVGAKWLNFNNNNGDKVIFTASEKSAAISFFNESGTGNCGSSGQNNTSNTITFTRGGANAGVPPNGDGCPSSTQKCFYAELFTIVVNAYPSETVGLEFDANGHGYEPKSTGGFCSLTISGSGSHNGLSNVTINTPSTYVNTANATIEAQLSDKEATNDGGYYFPIAIKNTGGTTRTVSYAEFVLKATLVQLDEPFSFLTLTPRTSADIVDLQTGQITRYLHYIINSPLTLSAGQSSVIGKVKIGPPTLTNKSWAASLDFEGAATKPRVRTAEACTRLKTSGGPISCSNIGFADAPCSDSDIHFKVKGIPGGCGDLRASVELYSANPPSTRQVEKLEFTIQFEFDSPNISFSSLEYPDWPSISCSQYGCFTPGVCYTMSADSKTFNYCFSVPSNAPTPFSFTALDPIKNMELVFSSTGKGCITKATVTKLSIKYAATSACIPRLDDIEGFSICANALRGTAKTYLGDGIENVSMSLKEAVVNTASDTIENCNSVTCSTSCGISTDLTDSDGAYSFCDSCTTCNRFMVEPERNDNPLNGVTTYDLVLISKHIIGTEIFDSPFKIIAADANKNGSVTTFDIIEFRKLILGIYTELPKTKSWRFINADYSFLDSLNPFQYSILQVHNCIVPQSSSVDFIGVKVGDVNNTAVAHRPGKRPVVHLAWPGLRVSPGEVVTVPVVYAGSEPLDALQLGLRFDPAQMQLLSPSMGDMESYTAACFNLLRAGEGEVKTLWLPMTDATEKIWPNTVLFYLSFKVLSGQPDSPLPLWLDEQLLDCAAWSPDGTEYAIAQGPSLSKREEPVPATAGLQASVRPNPTVGDATLVVQAQKADKARIALYDAFGSRLFMRELPLLEGRQDIPLPELAALPAGVYTWKVYTPSLKAQGHLIKQ